MSENFATFGREEAFAVHARWLVDNAPQTARPRGYGWSLGELRIYVGGQHVTSSRRASLRSGVRWYLSPFAHWLARNWAPLFHEERFPWGAPAPVPGNLAINMTLQSLVAEADEHSSAIYMQAQSWWGRHSLSSIDDGGLWPDLCLRRFGDLVELSWSNKPPIFAPERFVFDFLPGVSRLPIRTVAEPLWEFLAWIASTGPAFDQAGKDEVRQLEALIAALRSVPAQELEHWYAPSGLVDKAREHNQGLGDEASILFSERLLAPPILDELAPAVAMFGAVSPETTSADVGKLTGFLLEAQGGGDSEELKGLVEGVALRVGTPPHVQGGELARNILDWWEAQPGPAGQVATDVEELLGRLLVTVKEVQLETSSVRGVAIAGIGFQPTVVVNTRHPFNEHQTGRRFTLAHELCHILHDRGRSRRLSHASTPWTNPAVEKRANAFAAMLLMPPRLVDAAVRRATPPRATLDWAREIAGDLGTSVKATIEHLANLEFITPDEHVLLRAKYEGAFH